MKQRPCWTLELPGSKSITNRALLCAALAKGHAKGRASTSRIFGALKSDDSDVMLRALRGLGVKIKENPDYIEIHGTGGKFKSGKIILDLHNAGTATRFLTAVMILRDGETIITGDERMKERPIKDLIDGLRQLGASIEYLGKNGCPPLRIQNSRLRCTTDGQAGLRTQRRYTVRIKGDMSSQFISALLMIAPMLSCPLKIEVVGDLASRPYIDVTLDVLKKFGIKVVNNNYKSFIIRPQTYKPTNYTVEGDASAASYWTSIAYLHHGKVKFENLNKKSVQGDVDYECIIRSQMSGVRRQVSVDMSSMPDTAMTLAVTAPFIKGQTKITGLSTLRIKETDRLKALENELKKVGVKAGATDDSITIKGLRTQNSGFSRTQSAAADVLSPIKTYNDHRMAMCFAVVGTMMPGIVIENPGCTKKTYPDFWKDLELAYLSPIKLGQKNLVLTGMRCSGKTHLGKRIAEYLKREFVDIDSEIEMSQNIKITDIVKRYGWTYFRKIEQKMCSDLSGCKNLVISTGGGIVLDEKNIKNLRKNGIIAFVYADVSVLSERVKRKTGTRPSLTGAGSVNEIGDIWKERRDLYLKSADIVWDNTSGEIVERNLTKIFI